MNKIPLFAVVGLLAFAASSWAQETLAPLKNGRAPRTYAELWADYDPRAEPLDVEVLKQWEENGVVLKVLRYRIGIFKGKKAMMAAVYGFPKGARQLPGLVQIHGGGQYADYRAPLYNAKRGYATISLAWAGRINAPGYRVTPNEVKLFWEGRTDDPAYKLTTDWGALDAYHAPCRNPKNSFAHVKPQGWTLDDVDSPRNNAWILCTIGARRALTFLEKQPEVDPSRLGVYGHSMGGKLTVTTAGADCRVTAAAPSCGGLSNRNTGNALYDTTVADNVYLKHIRCPVVFLSPANDFHGRINDLRTSVREIASRDWRVVCSPHHNHQDTANYMVCGMLWFDQWLKNGFRFPETPQVSLQLKAEDGVPVLTVRPDASKSICGVDVFYTQQGFEGEDRENVIHRFWHDARPEHRGDTYSARLPLHTPDKPLWAYANVAYRLERPVTGVGYYYRPYTARQFVLSSPIQTATPTQLETAGAQVVLRPSLTIETFEGDWEKSWFTYNPEEWALRTHRIYDVCWKSPGDANLAVDVRCQMPNKLVVGVDQFAAEAELKGSSRWQTVVLSPGDFRDSLGRSPQDWAGTMELRLAATDTLRSGRGSGRTVRRFGAPWQGPPPEFRDLRWIPNPKPKAHVRRTGKPLSTAAKFWVSPTGDDTNPGTRDRPFASLAHARNVVRSLPQRGKQPVTVVLRGGTYRLRETLVLTAADSGTARAPVEYRSAAGETAVISGGQALRGLRWRPLRDGIQQTQVPDGFMTDQLFVNGKLMPMARYPNFDAGQRIFNGTAADALSDQRVARWHDPAGGLIHAMHRSLWGGMHFRITGKSADGKLMYEGGWQNNRPSAPHKKYRFVENIFEELDAPGEWFLDAKTRTLYFFPPSGLDLASAVFEGVRLRHLLEFRGDRENPVRFISLHGLTFRHAARTFMDNRQRMLRTDWTVYRGGALLLDGTEDCRITDCTIDHVGGNALFVNHYSRRLLVRGCHIFQAGGNGIAFVGDPGAVRSGLVGYASRASFADIDKTPGPKTPNYPADARVEDCLIHEIGRVEKQVAGVEIDMAMNITVSHCSIYDTPRAGINIGDGCWGGHVIEFCDVFDTVLETGDHGSFNSWGRDRFWGLKDVDLNSITLGENKSLPLLDVIHPNILRNNRWRCDHGWDIDLDDGSSNYEIRNNLCLNGGLKNREGFYRVVENNIVVNNSFHPHVWYGNSQDVFRHNIVFTPYRPIRVKPPWGRECDYNLLHQRGVTEPRPATELQSRSGRDEHSIVADARFVEPGRGDYRVKADSPALALGFENFPMGQFGVTGERLRRLARTPELPVPGAIRRKETRRDPRVITWLGAKVKNIVGLGEVSAAGLPGEIGVSLVKVPGDSAAARAGLHVGDVILKCAGRSTHSVADLKRAWSRASGQVALEVWRGQKTIEVTCRKQ